MSRRVLCGKNHECGWSDPWWDISPCRQWLDSNIPKLELCILPSDISPNFSYLTRPALAFSGIMSEPIINTQWVSKVDANGTQYWWAVYTVSTIVLLFYALWHSRQCVAVHRGNDPIGSRIRGVWPLTDIYADVSWCYLEAILYLCAACFVVVLLPYHVLFIGVWLFL